MERLGRVEAGGGRVAALMYFNISLCQVKTDKSGTRSLPTCDLSPLLSLQKAPGYFSVIKQPMDFTTMRRKLAAGQYSNYDDMEADLNLMFTNCMTYNPEGGCCWQLVQHKQAAGSCCSTTGQSAVCPVLQPLTVEEGTAALLSLCCLEPVQAACAALLLHPL